MIHLELLARHKGSVLGNYPGEVRPMLLLRILLDPGLIIVYPCQSLWLDWLASVLPSIAISIQVNWSPFLPGATQPEAVWVSAFPSSPVWDGPLQDHLARVRVIQDWQHHRTKGETYDDDPVIWYDSFYLQKVSNKMVESDRVHIEATLDDRVAYILQVSSVILWRFEDRILPD